MPTAALADVNVDQGVSDAWNTVATFVPKLAAFLVILLIGWLIARVLNKLAMKILVRVGFDRAVERGGINRMLGSSKLDASDIIAKLVYYTVLLITLEFGFGVWGPNPISNLLTAIVNWLPSAAIAIIIVVIAGAIARVVRDLIGSALGGLPYGRALGTLAAVFVWALGAIAALNQIGVATTVTTPVLITVLATVGGVIVVGVGGGLISPMQQRWQVWLDRLGNELPTATGTPAQQADGQQATGDAGASAQSGDPATSSR